MHLSVVEDHCQCQFCESGKKGRGREDNPIKSPHTQVASFPGHLPFKYMLHSFTILLAFKPSLFMMVMKKAGSRCFILTMKERVKCDSGQPSENEDSDQQRLGRLAVFKAHSKTRRNSLMFITWLPSRVKETR